MTELPDRIWAKIERTETCWLWLGGCTRNGYGKGFLNGKHVYIHRIVYEAMVGPLSADELIDHSCHVKRCCNPTHLLAVDNTGNGQNRRGPQVNSRSGIRGVHWHQGAQKWRVQAKAGGRIHSGGLFDSLDEARIAAKELRARIMTNSH